MTRKILSILCFLALLLAGCAAPANRPDEESGSEPAAKATATLAEKAPDKAAEKPGEKTAQVAAAATSLPEAAAPATPGGEVPWPTSGWQVSTPDAQGMDPAVLEKMLAKIEKRAMDLDSVLVIRNGYIVTEQYYDGNSAEKLHTQYSVTKSFISTLVGIAIDQGKLKGVDILVSDALPGRSYQNPDPRKDSMTVEDVLTMSTGLDWKEVDSSYRAMYTSPIWVEWVMNLKMAAEPGEVFNYCSGCSHILSAVVHEQTGEDVHQFARHNLFEPLGITTLRWEKDSSGLPIGGWGLDITSRDMAKFGYLFLHNGAWDGKQVLSPDWVKAATSKHIAGNDGRLDYGYQWWIDGQREGAYAALGRGGQMIYVYPAKDLVVVFTAGNVSHTVELGLIDSYVIPSIR